MDKAEFVYVSYIATTPERLWEALTQGDFTKQYWHGRRIASDWQLGSAVYFYDGESDVVTDSGEVLELDPPKRLSYSFKIELNPDLKAEPASRVTFNLEELEGMVKLTLIHDQFPNEEIANNFREGWVAILSSLKTLLETGEALRFKG